MNKKGFVLIETIFMTIVVIVALLIVYKSFVSVLQIEKERIYYDNTNYVYRTYVMRDYLIKSNISFGNNFLKSNGIVKLSCDSPILITTKSYCNLLTDKNMLDIKNMYITAYNPNLTTAEYESIPPTVANYLKAINTEEQGYRLLILFNDKNITSMSLFIKG